MTCPTISTSAPDPYILDEKERMAIRASLAGLSHLRPCLDESQLAELLLTAQELPRSLRYLLGDFRLGHKGKSGLILSGFPFGADELGPTPLTWPEANACADTPAPRSASLLLLLITALLGDVFVFGTQHGTNPVIDVFPIKGHESQQLGSSSETQLEWHNEDAFHMYRADYVVLFCLRNSGRVATMFGSVESIHLSDHDREVLSQPRFLIRPDESHTRRFGAIPNSHLGADRVALQSALSRMEHLVQCPDKVAVISGSYDCPQIRIDPYFMDTGDDEEAADVLRRFIISVDSSLTDVMLDSGDMLIIDNKRAVHGRRPFSASYDGNDRWLKRVNVTKDLRLSAEVRMPRSRVLV